MKKQLLLALAAGAVWAATDGKQTFTGVVTDSMCGASHKDMSMGPGPKCIADCVRILGAKYALVIGKQVFELSDQETPVRFAAKRVTVTGTLDRGSNTIQVYAITAAK